MPVSVATRGAKVHLPSAYLQENREVRPETVSSLTVQRMCGTLFHSTSYSLGYAWPDPGGVDVFVDPYPRIAMRGR